MLNLNLKSQWNQSSRSFECGVKISSRNTGKTNFSFLTRLAILLLEIGSVLGIVKYLIIPLLL